MLNSNRGSLLFSATGARYTGADLAGTTPAAVSSEYPYRPSDVLGSSGLHLRVEGAHRRRGRRVDWRVPSGRLPLPDGNYKARRRVAILKGILNELGFTGTGSCLNGSAPVKENSSPTPLRKWSIAEETGSESHETTLERLKHSVSG